MAEVEHIGVVEGFVSQEATIAPKQGIYESRDKAVCRLGTRIRVGPRVFYYAKYVADVAVGELIGTDTSANDVVDTDNIVVTTKNYAAAAGATKVEITLTTRTKNQYQDGFLHIVGGTGVGYTYGIRRNSATGSVLDPGDDALNATTSFMLELYDPIVLALGADTDIAITGCPFNNLRECPSAAATDDCPIGVNPIPFDVSEAPYGWVQTWGPIAVFQDDSRASLKGTVVTVSDGIAGAVENTATAVPGTEIIVGYGMEDGDVGEHAPVFLQLMP